MTKDQKIAALAYYLTELVVKNAYEMPIDVFWKFQYAVIVDIDYLFTKNPELYCSKTTSEQDCAMVYWLRLYGTKEAKLKTFKDDVFNCIERRNALLQ